MLAQPADVRHLGGATKGAGCAQLVAAWLRWREDRLLPRRSEIDLKDIAPLLPFVGLLEVLNVDDVRMRVAGTALRDIYGVEMTGRNLKEITAPEQWAGRSARYHALVGRPCGSFYTRRDMLPNGRIIVYESVGLPLDADDASTKRYVIFCVSTLGKSFAAEPPKGPRTVPMPTEFHFVDIGAGVPEQV